jgi:hypothetical protein
MISVKIEMRQQARRLSRLSACADTFKATLPFWRKSNARHLSPALKCLSKIAERTGSVAVLKIFVDVNPVTGWALRWTISGADLVQVISE